MGIKNGKNSEKPSKTYKKHDFFRVSPSCLSFFTKPQERFPHGRSYFMSNLSESLTVTLLLKAS